MAHWHSLIQPFFYNVYMVVEVSAIVPEKKKKKTRGKLASIF